MIKTIIIDDEKPALAKLQSLIKPYSNYVVCGEFTDAFEALSKIQELSPQVAFIDIAMPGMNGMELAAAINKKMDQKVHIVFVTAHEQYALPAFDLWATDYLLKPVSRSRFEQTIMRLNALIGESAPQTASVPQDERTMVRLFGKLEVTRPGQKIDGWRTAKVRELFAFFLHNRNRSIFKDTLLETLWEDMSPSQALANLNTCNYYLRRHLEKSDSGIKLLYDAGYYSIDLGAAICDVDEFEKAEGLANALNESNLEYVLSGAALYRGRYFEDVKCTWADLDREHYASRYVRLRTMIADYYLKSGKYDEALEQAKLALDVNRLSTDAWRILHFIYKEKDEPALYKRTRENMKRVYLEYTGKEPPADF